MASLGGKAIIEILPNRFFVGVWFVGDGRQDWMACIFKDPGSNYTHRCRFRYYRSSEVWNSGDVKNEYETVFHPHLSADDVEHVGQEMADLVAHTMGATKISYLRLHSDNGRHVMDQLALQDWSHLKILTKEEAREQGYLE